jgi:dipicolinate synthase subunit B
MELKYKNIGFCLTGSFCTFSKIFPVIEKLVELGANITPIISKSVDDNDTRFIKVAELKRFLKLTTQKNTKTQITEVEPIGPKKLLDLLIVAPCTGNTLAKIANGISDTAVTLAVKSHLRNDRPVLIALSTNDALSGNARNLGLLLNTKNIYFVPMGQDDFEHKKTSVVADMNKIIDAASLALEKTQIQPIFIAPK